MRIKEVKAIVTCPTRNYVVVKIILESGVYGVGDATLNGRELAVAEAIIEHIGPQIIGMEADRIEDIWQFLFRGTYWRGGPVLMTALAGIDMALWDIKGKVAGLPVYQLLGGKTRDKVRTYRHAGGKSLEECLESLQELVETEKCDAVRLGIYTRSKPGWEPFEYMRDTPKMFDYIRSHIGGEIDLLHDVHERLTPIQSAQLAKALEPYNLFFYEDPIRPEYKQALKIIRQHSTIPIAMGELFTDKWECLSVISEQLVDYIRVDISHIGGITEARKIAALAELYHVRTAFHGPGDISPIAHSAHLSVDLSIPNFGIQEFVQFPEEVQEVFPGGVVYKDGYLYSNEQPGLGIDIDEKLAAKYEYKRSYLPTLRRADQSVQDW